VKQSSLFLPAFGNKPAFLVGRDALVGGFQQALTLPPGHAGRTILMVGQRGMGKTALLLKFEELALGQGYVAAKVTANRDMLQDIVGLLQKNGSRFVRSQPKVKGASVGAFGFSAGLTFAEEADKSLSFLNKMILLCEELQRHGKGVALLIDEVQASTPDLEVLATTYQSLVGEGLDVCIVMAGLPHTISAVLNDDILTFLHRATKVYLEPLALADVGVAYAKAFAQTGKSISPADLQAAAAATKGYPYLLQLIGYYVLQYADGESSITSDSLSNAVASARQDMAANIYQPVMRLLSRKDEAFLRAMAQDAGPSRISDIIKRLKASANTVQAYRRRLIDMGVIASERRGELEIIIPYLGEYLHGEI